MTRVFVHIISFYLSIHVLLASTYADSVIRTASLPFTEVDGLILVDIKVDSKSGTFILDSGAPSLILHATGHHGDEVFATMDREISASATTIDRLEVGPVTDQDVAAWQMDLSFLGEQLGVEVAGVLGADFLERRELLIDYNNHRIIFLDHVDWHLMDIGYRHSVIKLPFVNHYSNLPVVEVELAGQIHSMAFDTGAGMNVMSHMSSDQTVTDIKMQQLVVKQMQFVHRDLSQVQDQSEEKMRGILSPHALNADFVIISYKKKAVFLFYEKNEIAGAF